MAHAANIPKLTADSVSLPKDHAWRKLPIIFGVVGIAAVVASIGLKGSWKQFWHSYLVGYVFLLSIALGAWFFVIFNHASRAGWSITVRRVAENLAGTMPLMLLLALPIILFGMEDLYHHWLHMKPDDTVLQHKKAWLDKTFFQIRIIFYLVVWSGCIWWLRRQSIKQDETGDERIAKRLRGWSNPMIAVFALTVTPASFDLLMSLDPHWFSTIYGVYYFAGCLIAVFSVLIIVTKVMNAKKVLPAKVVTIEHFHDLGKYLFAFSVFWAYIAFSQFMLYWYGNIPEETIFYAKRWFVVPPHDATSMSPHAEWPYSTWRPISIFLAAGHFGVPFFFLMSRWVKRLGPWLWIGALWMLFMHLVDTFWLVMPNLHVNAFGLHVVDFTLLIGLAGLFAAAFFWLLGRHPLVPVKDPRLEESLKFENF